jgi:hypothetical protein
MGTRGRSGRTGPSSLQRYLWAGHLNLPYLPLLQKKNQKVAGHEISSFARTPNFFLSTSNSFAMATVDLSHVQLIWQPPLKPTSSKRRASPHTRKNGRSGPTTSSRDQPALLHNKADEILGRDKQPKSAVALAQHQGRDSAFQQEGDAVGAQGATREDSRDEPG